MKTREIEEVEHELSALGKEKRASLNERFKFLVVSGDGGDREQR